MCYKPYGKWLSVAILSSKECISKALGKVSSLRFKHLIPGLGKSLIPFRSQLSGLAGMSHPARRRKMQWPTADPCPGSHAPRSYHPRWVPLTRAQGWGIWPHRLGFIVGHSGHPSVTATSLTKQWWKCYQIPVQTAFILVRYSMIFPMLMHKEWLSTLLRKRHFLSIHVNSSGENQSLFQMHLSSHNVIKQVWFRATHKPFAEC